MQLKTVNVIIKSAHLPMKIYSYANNDSGKEAAYSKFTIEVLRFDPSIAEEILIQCLDSGFTSKDNNTTIQVIESE